MLPQAMAIQFETLGNASLLVYQNGIPVLATDPWLRGTCYFGSWALDHPMSDEQIAHVVAADYLWISHGHPDHLHDESLSLMPPGKKILLPDHYDQDIANHLRGMGFDVVILAYRTWFQIRPSIRVLCIDNLNQDAILVVEAEATLIVNLNDSPLCGEGGFLRRLIKSYPRERSYLLALCSVDADMFNFVDENGVSLAGHPQERKPGAVWAVARAADSLGVGNFCCSSSQHIYIRADSIWANPYRIGWPDMQRFWSRPHIRLIEPFVTVEIPSGNVIRNHPSQTSDTSQISDATGDDDWSASLSDDDWKQVEAFVRKFELVRQYLGFIAFTVGGETRRFVLDPDKADKGLIFIVPRESLMTTVTYGYLDDLLIGNFMKVRLVSTRLYPRFTPLVAKLGGNAKVYTRAQYHRFLLRYFRRNPIGTLRYLFGIELDQVIIPWLRHASEPWGLKPPLRYIYRRVLGDPRTPGRAAWGR